LRALVFIFCCWLQVGCAAAPRGEFPSEFKWCVATAAHQIEGGNTNSDWWDWEQAGHIFQNQSSNPADDHWNRVSEDIALLQQLHVRQYRFSVEWAKIEPIEGQFDEAVIAHYANEVRLLQAAHIQPMITLQHFTLPHWVAQKGGWAWEGMPKAFEKMTELVRRRIGPQVRDWVTTNEPMIMLLLGYLEGSFPPGLPTRQKPPPFPAVIPPLVGLLKAHALAYHKLHEFDQQPGFVPARVSMAHHLRIFDAKYFLSPFDQVGAWFSNRTFNWVIPQAIETGVLDVFIPFVVNAEVPIEGLKGTEDYFGLNYYSRDQVHFDTSAPAWLAYSAKQGTPHSDLDWEIYPEGLETLLLEIHRRYPKLSIAITENGVADKEDRLRSDFLISHLQRLQNALGAGVPVEGYCHWSLYDNFEWINGYPPRFGLFAVDYETQKRTLRKSGELFSQVALKNALPKSEEQKPSEKQPDK